MMFKRILLVYFVLFSCCLYADSDYLNTPRTIRVGLELVGKPSSTTVTPSSGILELFDLGKQKTLFSGKASEVKITGKKGGNMNFVIDGKTYTASNSVSISEMRKGTPAIKSLLSIISAKGKKYTYRGSFEVRCFGQQLYFINIVDIEDYLKSVVPSEISIRAPKSAQEAQAIAARTYAVRNIDRHTKKEDFNVCDTVHCQAYFGISKEVETANSGIKSTCGQILVYDNSPANTVYHSNCGGYIISSQAAWGGKGVPYLIGHYDGVKGDKPFCDYGRNFQSKQPQLTLPKKSKKLVIGVTDTLSKKKVHANFGHRVGMCQDGAIGMSIIGYNCGNILGFYYPLTKIVTLKYAGKDGKQIVPTKVANTFKIAKEAADAKISEKTKQAVEKTEPQLMAKAAESEKTIKEKSVDNVNKTEIADNKSDMKIAEAVAVKEETDKKNIADSANETTIKAIPAVEAEETVLVMALPSDKAKTRRRRSVLDTIRETFRHKKNNISDGVKKNYWGSMQPKNECL